MIALMFEAFVSLVHLRKIGLKYGSVPSLGMWVCRVSGPDAWSDLFGGYVSKRFLDSHCKYIAPGTVLTGDIVMDKRPSHATIFVLLAYMSGVYILS